MLCQTPIELGHSVVTYCVLPAKHEGRCEPEKAPCRNCTALLRWWKEHGKQDEIVRACAAAIRSLEDV
jgi:hypothetical protein